jgi:hypothetical protein
MTDQHGELLQKLAELRKMVDEATLGPWSSMESKDHWSLHGHARQFKGKIKPSMQILKAPKHGTPYAEYWPNAADGAIITKAVNFFPFWLDWADDVAARHYPTICGCSKTHFLCAPHRSYQWEQCPEIKSLVRAVEMFHE